MTTSWVSVERLYCGDDVGVNVKETANQALSLTSIRRETN